MINNSVKLWRLKLYCLFCSILSLRKFCCICLTVLFEGVWHRWLQNIISMMFYMNLIIFWMLSLQKLVGSGSLEDVLDPAQVNPQFIMDNMTKVNKHGVVSLEDKTGRLDMCHFSLKMVANIIFSHSDCFLLFCPPLRRRFTSLGFVCHEMSCKL